MSSSHSPLVNHMSVFANSEGYVTISSIVDACMEKFSMTHGESVSMALKVFAAGVYTGVPGCIHGKFKPEDAVGKMNHPGDTGFFDLHGQFDRAQWEKLMYDPSVHPEAKELPKDKIIVDTLEDGRKIIFASNMRAFNSVNHKNNERWKSAGFLFHALGNAGNEGEFDQLYKSFSSVRAINPASGINESAIELSELEQFYLDSRVITDRAVKPEMPAKSSTAAIGAMLEKSKPTASMIDKVLDKLVDCARGVVADSPSYFPPGNFSYWKNASAPMDLPVPADGCTHSGTMIADAGYQRMLPR